QRFTSVADFGFSKNAKETLDKWDGHDTALRDLVRVIRTFRPDVIISRFQGTSADGHGNHEASGILTKEAFRAAADPNRFPEQIKEGLLPWQAKKFYQGGLFRQVDDANLKLDLGSYDPTLAASYAQFAVEGLAHQTSQGVGGLRLPPGHRIGYYRLVDTVLPNYKPAEEKDFFDGIDTSLTALASRLGVDQKKAQFLSPALYEISKQVDEAFAALSPADTSRVAAPLLKGLNLTNNLIHQVETSVIADAIKTDLLVQLRTKQQQFEEAINLAMGIALDLSVDPPGANPPGGFARLEQTFQMAVPGQTFTLTARLYNRGSQSVAAENIRLLLPQDWKVQQLSSELKPLGRDDVATVRFQVTVPSNAPYTRPYWHRDDPYRESVNTIDQPQYLTLPLPPWPVSAAADFRIADQPVQALAVAQVKYIDPVAGQRHRSLPIGPPFSVEMGDANYVVPALAPTRPIAPITLLVTVRSNLTGPSETELSLKMPPGWRSEPASHAVRLQGEGDAGRFAFTVVPAELREQQYPIRAVVKYLGKDYSDSVTMVSRPDLDTFYYYRPAVQNVSAVNTALPKNLKIGYVMGAGDEIP